MPDFQETLRDLKNTEGFFQRETQEYKDFRNALSDLNKAMQTVGNRALTDREVRNLRQLLIQDFCWCRIPLSRTAGDCRATVPRRRQPPG